MDTRLQNVVPPEGTCAGKATLVDASDDPIGYHLSEALRLVRKLNVDKRARDTCIDICDAIASWERERPR